VKAHVAGRILLWLAAFDETGAIAEKVLRICQRQ